MSTQLLTTRDVSARLGLSLQTINTLCATGRLKSSLICNRYRIEPASLDSFIEAQIVKAK